MYPVNRGFFLARLLAFTKWFAWLVRRKERRKQTNYATVKPRTTLQMLKATLERELYVSFDTQHIHLQSSPVSSLL